MDRIKEKLFDLADEDYRNFHAKLMPSVPKEKIIGVRIPLLRNLAKELVNYHPEEVKAFCRKLPHEFYEENNLHAFIICQERDIDKIIEDLETFLPFVDNWATCDSMIPKMLKKDPGRLILKVRQWLNSEHTYTVRFGINMLMKFFLDDNFKTEYADWVAALPPDDYYVMMGAAWYFATALSKRYDEIIGYIKEKRLPPRTHAKAIQKALESYCISKEQKQYLKNLK